MHLTDCPCNEWTIKGVRGHLQVTHARRRWGLSGLGWGAGSRKARTAHTVARSCCADSPRTRRRSRCRSSCTRPGQSGRTWRAGYTRTLRQDGGQQDLKVDSASAELLRLFGPVLTLAGVGVSPLCRSPRQIVVEVLTALTV